MSPNAKPNPIPDRYRRVTPALMVNGGAKAIEFYTEVFGAAERMRFPGPDGTVAHAEIVIGDSVIIIEDASPYRGTKAPPPDGLDGSPAFLYIYVEDVDAVIERAVLIIDPFGHGWTIGSHVEDVAPDEMVRRVSELQAGA